MKTMVLVFAVCSVLTTARNVKSSSYEKDKDLTESSDSKDMGDFYQKLSNIPSSNNINGKIDNIQKALEILHGYLDTVKDSVDTGKDTSDVTDDAGDAAVQNELDNVYRKIKNLYTTVENAGNSRVYKSLNSLYSFLYWMYGEEFAKVMRQELPIDDMDLQIEPGNAKQSGQSKDKSPHPIVAQLVDIGSMLKDINSNAKVMLDDDTRNANFINAMSRALHKIYSDRTSTQESPSTTPGSQSASRTMNVVNRKLEELLSKMMENTYSDNV